MSRGFLLDTNIPSEQILPRPQLRVSQWLYAQPEETLFLSAVTIGELRKGIVLLKASKRKSELEQWLDNDLAPRFRHRILPVTLTIADRWGINERDTPVGRYTAFSCRWPDRGDRAVT